MLPLKADIGNKLRFHINNFSEIIFYQIIFSSILTEDKDNKKKKISYNPRDHLKLSSKPEYRSKTKLI